MTDKKITGAIEFISTKGERGGIDLQINEWLDVNPKATIIDVQYRVAMYQDGGKNKIAKLALVLYHNEESEASAQSAAKKAQPEETTEEPSEKKGPEANTMIMSLRREMKFDEPEED